MARRHRTLAYSGALGSRALGPAVMSVGGTFHPHNPHTVSRTLAPLDCRRSAHDLRHLYRKVSDGGHAFALQRRTSITPCWSRSRRRDNRIDQASLTVSVARLPLATDTPNGPWSYSADARRRAPRLLRGSGRVVRWFVFFGS